MAHGICVYLDFLDSDLKSSNMLLLLQFAAQQLPPIYVTVQQPAGGMPEWAKILISAATGALLGVISSIAMEYAKPWIAKRVMRSAMAVQLGIELMENQSKVEAAGRVLRETEEKSTEERTFALLACKVIASTIDSDRFDYYFAAQKVLVYELDEGRSLVTFYQITKTLVTIPRDYKETSQTFVMAAAMGNMYIKTQGLTYKPMANPLEEVFRKQQSSDTAEQPVGVPESDAAEGPTN